MRKLESGVKSCKCVLVYVHLQCECGMYEICMYLICEYGVCICDVCESMTCLCIYVVYMIHLYICGT